jgi:hypothetical protein
MIKILKLVTGEELVGDVNRVQSTITISKPFMITMARDPANPSGDMQLALFPYVPYVKDHKLQIDEKSIIWMTEIVDSMVQDYERAIDSLKITEVAPENKEQQFTTFANITKTI